MDKHDAPDLRAALVSVVLSAPDDREVGPGQGWEPVPGDHGVVLVSGDPAEPRERWVIEGSEVTVAQLRAARDLLIADGLGSRAHLRWQPAMMAAAAHAWGPTPEQAVVHLVESLRRLWPDLRAAVVDPVVAGAWASEEVRTTAAGISIIAPPTDPADGVASLFTRRAYVRIDAGVDGDESWLTRLEQGLAFDPLSDALALQTAHRVDGAAARFRWSAPHRTDDAGR